jgi:hypothetical protein
MIVVKKMLLAFKLKKGNESLCGGRGNRKKRKRRGLLNKSYSVKLFRTFRKQTKESCS